MSWENKKIRLYVHRYGYGDPWKRNHQTRGKYLPTPQLEKRHSRYLHYDVIDHYQMPPSFIKHTLLFSNECRSSLTWLRLQRRRRRWPGRPQHRAHLALSHLRVSDISNFSVKWRSSSEFDEAKFMLSEFVTFHHHIGCISKIFVGKKRNKTKFREVPTRISSIS